MLLLMTSMYVWPCLCRACAVVWWGFVVRLSVCALTVVLWCACVQGLNEVVQGSPEIISRFFVHNNYSPEECRVVVELLTSDKYQSYDAITNTDYREIIFGAPPFLCLRAGVQRCHARVCLSLPAGSAENVESWQDARAEVKALNLETATEGLLSTCCCIAAAAAAAVAVAGG